MTIKKHINEIRIILISYLYNLKKKKKSEICMAEKQKFLFNKTNMRSHFKTLLSNKKRHLTKKDQFHSPKNHHNKKK